MIENPLPRYNWTAVLALKAGAAAVLFGALFYTKSMRDVFVLPKMIPVAIGAVLLCLSAVISKTSRRRSLSVPIAAMWAAMVVSTVFSTDIPMSLLGPHQQQFYAVLPLLLCTLVYYGASSGDGIRPASVSKMLLMAAIPVCLWALVQAAGYDGVLSWSIQNGRAGSTFGSPIFLGAFLAMVLPVAAAAMSEGSALGSIVAVLTFAAIFATRSRGAFIAGGFGIMLVGWLSFRELRPLFVAGAVVMAVCLVGLSTGKPTDSDAGRTEVWRTAINAWRVRPWFGWGPDTFMIAFRCLMTDRFVAVTHNDFTVQMGAHNDVLQVLSTLGLFGILAYSFFMNGVIQAVKTVLAKPGVPAAAGALFALFIQAKVNPIPLSVLAMAALFLASLEISDAPAAPSRWSSGAAALASIATMLLVGRFCMAERYQKLGEDARVAGNPIQAAQDFNLAAQANPLDIYYTQKQVDYLWSILPIYGPWEKRGVGVASLVVSERAVTIHPNDATAHEIRAMSMQFAYNLLDIDVLDGAKREIMISEYLAPKFSGYTKRREQIENLIAATQRETQGRNPPSKRSL